MTDPSYPPSSGGPPPIGFEMLNNQGVGFEPLNTNIAAPPPPPSQLYGHNGLPQEGPTPVETSSLHVSTVDVEAQNNPSPPPIGFEGHVNPTYTGHDEIDHRGVRDTQDIMLLNRRNIPGKDDDGISLVENSEDKKPMDSKSDEPAKSLFHDGVRQIDFILAYQVGTSKHEDAREQKRKTFQQNLKEEGLEMEEEDKSNSQDGKTYFVKLHAPWEVLTRYAELMKMKMPIKENDLEEETSEMCGKCPSCFDIPEGLIPEEPNYFTAAFDRERHKQYIIQDQDSFFTNAQRSRIVYEILKRAKYEEGDKDKFGIKRMLCNNSYTAAFPLHDGPAKSSHSVLTRGAENPRHLLHETWARPGRWYTYQPLDQVRTYFGEKIGIYFTWLGFYTIMLIPASIVGLIVFLYGCASLGNDKPSMDICNVNGPGNLTMCPRCNTGCHWWKLSNSCLYSRVTYLVDNPGTVFFAAFMALWATMFLEFWKRKQAEIAYDWDVSDFEEEEETVRPEYEAEVRHKKKNPVTQEYEPWLPLWNKIVRFTSAFILVIFMLCLVLGAIFGVIVYRIIIVTLFYRTDNTTISQNARLATTITAAIINLVIIVILNKIYQIIAIKLTNIEYPRTDTEWEDSFTLKMFLFQCINFYGTLVYIAFFKGRFIGSPGHYMTLFSNRQEECDPAGCLIELCIQLIIIMIGKQAINNAKEILVPILLNWWRARKAKKTESETNLYTRWEQDYDLGAMPPLGLFEEYLEMVIQYGFVTIFVAAFPLAPLFALINNMIEIRLDAYKFVTQWRRPLADRAEDIGVWWGILLAITKASVLTNACIIAFTSDFIPRLYYKWEQSPDQSLDGYIVTTLSKFDTVDDAYTTKLNTETTASWYGKYGDVSQCYYRDYRDPHHPYGHAKLYWHLMALRLAFVIIFEHAVFIITMAIGALIPDTPTAVKIQQLRENYLAKEALYSAELGKTKQDRSEP